MSDDDRYSLTEIVKLGIERLRRNSDDDDDERRSGSDLSQVTISRLTELGVEEATAADERDHAPDVNENDDDDDDTLKRVRANAGACVKCGEAHASKTSYVQGDMRVLCRQCHEQKVKCWACHTVVIPHELPGGDESCPQCGAYEPSGGGEWA